MKRYFLYQTANPVCTWAYVIICLALVLGGCQAKEMPLSKATQACKQGLLEEMGELTTSLAEPVAQQDWEAVRSILQTAYEEMEKEGKFVPMRIVVLDRNAITQGMFPPRKEGPLDFSNYGPARTVFAEKRKTQAMLYLKDAKIFIFMAPLLQKDQQITGAVVMGFPEEELQKWKVPEEEFLKIDFNQ